MKFIHRLGYYLGGFSIGLIVLAFFLSGKKTSCSYGPEARVIKNINSKKLVYSQNAYSVLTQNTLDTTKLNAAIKHGNIIFSKSETRKEPCASYYLENTIDDKNVAITIENCDSIATVTHLKILE
ncbi:hypothetical protein PW52_05355 [Tamlana sedimentorum]|uniref:DUF4258 domain-containing protein n=1 Tax=Neotamlana sedimentorum TaxID=1435349 RepID=A0A0D7WA66_9FLAO|nr:DUF4258 domain-containing protein [Tamlana sedimentorum]KJD36045.1 hypothetical protein PW52_05355 [Tamlana sedimentorum]